MPSLTTDVVALDLSSGKLRWRFRAYAHVKMSPVAHDGHVYFGDTNGVFYDINEWSRQSLRIVRPAFYDGAVRNSGEFAVGGLRQRNLCGSGRSRVRAVFDPGARHMVGPPDYKPGDLVIPFGDSGATLYVAPSLIIAVAQFSSVRSTSAPSRSSLAIVDFAG